MQYPNHDSIRRDETRTVHYRPFLSVINQLYRVHHRAHPRTSLRGPFGDERGYVSSPRT